MFENATIKVADLRFDQNNPRLGEAQDNQPATALALAKKQGKQFLRMAKDIVEHGIDPTNRTIVVPTGDTKRRYVVLEGNRRLLALKALETPALVAGALTPAEQKQLEALSKRYLEDPYDEIDCVLFPSEKEAAHWIVLRHTGQNEGAGLVTWDSPEIERWRERAGASKGPKSLGVQALDFAERINGGKLTESKVVTNIDRLVSHAACRTAFGLEVHDKQLYAVFPADEIMKPLRKIIEDLASKTIKVKNIYDSDDKLAYLKTFDPSDLPDPGKRLKKPVLLSEIKPGRKSGPPPSKTSGARRGKSGGAAGKGGGGQARTTLATNKTKMSPTQPRINDIFIELLRLDVTQYPNAAAVLFRVFVEFNVDHYMQQHQLSLKPGTKDSLANKMKLVAAHLRQAGKINEPLRRAVDRVAHTGSTVLSASTFTFNQYVHNYYTFAKSQELFASWDELEPFLEKLA